jgi:hypothetical protein
VIAGGLAVAVEKSVHAALSAEASQARLDQAFKNAGLSAKDSAAQIDAVEASSRKLGFTDEDVRNALGSLVTATGSVKKSMVDVGVAQDLARFKGVSLVDATKMITMAMTGSQRAAKQLGITVIPLTTNVDRLKKSHDDLTTASGKLRVAHAKLLDKMATGQAVIDAVTAKTKGQGAAFANTAAGGIQAYKAQIEHLQETLGAKLLPALQNGLDWLNRLMSRINSADGARAKIQVVFDSAKDAGRALEQRLTEVVSGIDWTAVGSRVATGMGSGIAKAKEWATALNGMFAQIDWVALGRKAGPGIVAALATAIATALDPSFWIKNWDLALALAVVFFGKGLGKVAGKLAAPLARVFGDAVIATAGVIERLSPRLAEAFLSGVLRLPGLLRSVFGRIEALVGATFGKLGGLAKFAIRVLGVEAAINTVVAFAEKVKQWIDKVVAWFKGLPGRIRGAIGSVSLADIGVSIIDSLFGGMKSKFEQVKSWASSVGGWIKKLKGPKAKDEVLLVEEGRAIMGGLLVGMQGGWKSNEAWLAKLGGRLQAAMNRLQGQLDASQQRQQDASNQKAFADAQKALAEAKKKGKGIADAERSMEDALMQIRDTARQRELDKLTKQHDKIIAKLDKLKQRAADKLQQMRDVAGNAFDALAAKIQTAFGAKNDAFVSPAQGQISSIEARRRQEDMAQAVTDAQSQLADAIANGGDVEAAQRTLQRAQEDILLASLETQAADQDRAHQQQVDAQQEALDKMLANLRTKLTEQGTTWNAGMQGILDVISKYDGPFESIGGLLGDAFVKGLRDAMNAAAGASADVRSSGGGGGAIESARAIKGTRMIALASGGTITKTGAALVHRGETVIPAGARGGGSSITINLPNYLGSEREVAEVIRTEILRIKDRNGSSGF